MHPAQITRRRGALSCTPNESQDYHQKAWRLIDALTAARKDYKLLPQSIAVLKALVSFLPKDGSSFLVWPSNATLCERACGMSERSLRRHLERLIEAGLIARKASSNGKRFALRRASCVIEAFGFDLSGLFEQAEEILQSAQQEAERQAELQLLRGLLRQKLYALSPLPCAELGEEILLALRHRDNLEALRAYAALIDALPQDAPETASQTDLTATNSQNDRQIQNTKKESFYVQEATFDASFEDCLEAVGNTLAFSPNPIRNWQELSRFGYELAGMIGISDRLMTEAGEKMGRLAAALTVLCLGQKIGQIHRPIAYFHGLVQRATEGRFSLSALLLSAKRHARLQAQA